MKSTEKQIAIVDQIVSGVLQTDEWLNIQLNDPAIKRASEKFADVLDRLKPLVPEELADELDIAVGECLSALETPAIMYGVFVADAIRTVSANPSDVSRHMLERIED